MQEKLSPLFENIESYDVRHLPIIRAYLEKMKIAQIIDEALDCKMNCSPGRIAMGLILDILTGRSPLFRVQEFFKHQDSEIVIGGGLPSSALSDDNIGRVLDRIFKYGTQKLFSSISFETVKQFAINSNHIHADTTSVNVWGEYANSKNSNGVTITHGYSKDHRPDLKQFVFSLLCVEKNIPIFGKIEDGNASDKKINNRILLNIAKYMEDYSLGKKSFVYVADSALITPDNLKLLGSHDQKDSFKFISRLPESYNECSNVEMEALNKNAWIDIGVLSSQCPTKNRIPAEYKCYDSFVTIDGQRFRAVVIHSNVLDKRRQKKIARELKKDKAISQKIALDCSKIKFACEEDARNIAAKYESRKYHKIEWTIQQKNIFKPGRPKKNQERKVTQTYYILKYTITENSSAIGVLRDKAGCFVLLTTIHQSESSGKRVLEIYKEQYGVEQNFNFLKDPLIVNDLFLKSPERIEALGIVLLISLLVWRLLERNMRQYIEQHDLSITGWDNKPTKKPTAFMMTTKFSDVHVLKNERHRWLSRPLTTTQIEYLNALDLSEDIFFKVTA